MGAPVGIRNGAASNGCALEYLKKPYLRPGATFTELALLIVIVDALKARLSVDGLDQTK